MQSHTAPEQTPTILIVDDTLENLQLLAGMLKERGYKTRPTSSGELALQAVREAPPDLILLDINMPGMSGDEVCERLKADPELKDIPVLFLIALSETMDKIKAFSVGGVDYVSKPFQFEEVEARVRTHLEIRRQKRELRESYARLQELERLRDSLIHMIVHDMRAPLHVIMGNARMMEKGLNGPLTDQQKSSLGMMLTIVRQLSEMASTILDVNRLEEGRMPLRKAWVDPREIVRKTIDGMPSLLARVTLKVSLPEEPVEVLCDSALIKRVIVNLVDNALTFMPTGGALGVTLSQAGDTIKLRVSDSGPGIPAVYHKKIFEKFWQVEGRQENRTCSTGLGLAFCKLAVEAHGGAIGVDSSEGKGSTFWFVLPRRGMPGGSSPAPLPVQDAAPAPTGEDGPRPRCVSQATRILVIDDDRAIRQWIIDILRLEGYETLAAPDGVAGVDLAKKELPDLIISDVLMPGLDGYGVVTTLKGDPPTSGIPVILLTGSDDRHGVRQGMGLGADDYIAKPCDASDLLASVRARLEKKRSLGGALDELKTHLSLMVPHEFRTPLMAILGYSEIMLEDLNRHTFSEDNFRHYAQAIRRAGERLFRLVENYVLYASLAVRQAGGGKGEGGELKCDPVQIVGQVAKRLSTAYGREDDVNVHLEDAVVGMPVEYFTKIVEELLDNALKFSVKATPVTLSGVVVDGSYVLECADKGRGMSEEQVRRIQPFMQFDRAKHEQQGMGLGLALVRTIVDMACGLFSVQSALGEGTMIRIALPISKEKPQGCA